MHLMTQIKAYAEEIDNNLNIQSLAVNIEASKAIFDKLEKDVVAIQQLAQTYHVFKTHVGFEHQLYDKFTNLSEALKKVKNIWQKNKEQLREDKKFAELLQSLEGCHTAFKQTLHEYWQQYMQNLKQEFFVEKTLFNGVAYLPGQVKVYTDYVAKQKEFDSKSKALPLDVDALQSILDISKQLTALRAEMRFDVPQVVQNFLQHLNGSSTANVNLSDMTPEIYQWLYENDHLKNFTVQRKWDN
jgi:hypothetical protein